MIKSVLISVSGACLLLLSGCGSDSTTAASVTTPTATTPTATTPTATTPTATTLQVTTISNVKTALVNVDTNCRSDGTIDWVDHYVYTGSSVLVTTDEYTSVNASCTGTKSAGIGSIAADIVLLTDENIGSWLAGAPNQAGGAGTISATAPFTPMQWTVTAKTGNATTPAGTIVTVGVVIDDTGATMIAYDISTYTMASSVADATRTFTPI